MEFKSRFVRGLPVLALAASLLVPFKPLAAAEGPYTAAAPVVSAAPAAQIIAADPAGDIGELDAAGKLRQPGHGKKRHLTAANPTAAADDELDAARKLRRPRHDKKLGKESDLIAAADILGGKKDHHRKPRSA